MKRGLVIHVHGVASPEEAEQLESLGVDLIGVVVGERATGRVIARDDAHAIAACLKRTRLCVELLGEASLLEPQAARRMGVQVVQVPWGTEVPQTWRQALARAGIEWALVRVPADEDDDPAWVRARIEEAGTPPPAWTQVEICPSLEDGWRVIRDASENELDARDLDALAAKLPLLFSLPLRLDEVKEIRRGLFHARGFSFTLGDKLGEARGAHHFSLNQVRKLLKRLEAESN
ncbi:hypothetical protein [Cystobacter fuscus]|uniref:hypothetical protein n=1 Tax=Cystobacter fuscus TaxID=43 RepID=UPI002B2D572F|nr:hypothetical protein F0U63_46540 [Cystobacter fuscus]